MFPRRLVFSGGGTRCLVFLQSLIELERRGRLAHVREFWGTSAGALLASLYALTRSAAPLKDVMFAANYLRFRDIDVSNIIGIQSSWGLDDGRSLVNELERVFDTVATGSRAKCMKDISGLNIIVSDLTEHRTIVCNSNTFPDLRVIDAIRASMSLPIYFRPYVNPVNGHIWVDGAIRQNFPWEMLPSDEARAEALGFNFDKSWIGGPKTFMEYIFSMIHFDEPKKNSELRERWGRNIIWYPSPPYPAWFVRLRAEDFTLIERIGREAFERYESTLRDSELTLESSGTRPESVLHHMSSQDSPVVHTVGTSENLQSPSLLVPPRSSSLLQWPPPAS